MPPKRWLPCRDLSFWFVPTTKRLLSRDLGFWFVPPTRWLLCRHPEQVLTCMIAQCHHLMLCHQAKVHNTNRNNNLSNAAVPLPDAWKHFSQQDVCNQTTLGNSSSSSSRGIGSTGSVVAMFSSVTHQRLNQGK